MKALLLVVVLFGGGLVGCGSNADRAMEFSSEAASQNGLVGQDGRENATGVDTDSAVACLNEASARAKSDQYVCVYEKFYFQGDACCVPRVKDQKYIQIPEKASQAHSSGSIVFHGKVRFGYSANRILDDQHFACLNAFSSPQLNPMAQNWDFLKACRQYPLEGISMTSGVWNGSVDRMAYSSDRGVITLFGTKTVIIEGEDPNDPAFNSNLNPNRYPTQPDGRVSEKDDK